MINNPFTKEELISFIHNAGNTTYSGGAQEDKQTQNPGFIEYSYSDKDFSYKDSYTGYYKSQGMEVVRYKGQPVWIATYGGRMTEGNENLANECFEFLKKAMSHKDSKVFSHRGAELLEDGKWKHTYNQDGDVEEFSGYEEIYYKEKLVFFHRTIGGLVIDK